MSPLPTVRSLCAGYKQTEVINPLRQHDVPVLHATSDFVRHACRRYTYRCQRHAS